MNLTDESLCIVLFIGTYLENHLSIEKMINIKVVLKYSINTVLTITQTI